MQNTIIELKNTLEEINNRLYRAVDQISQLKDKAAEDTQSEKK